MKKFGITHPVLFELILYVAAFLLALIGMLGCSLFYVPSELVSSIGRILAGIVLYAVFRYCFRENRIGAGLVLIVPGLLFVVWNLVTNRVISGLQITDDLLPVVITALAPALFEEVIFRGIFLYNLKENGQSDLAALLISAVIFGLVHLTNAAGMNLLNVLVQTGYAIVVGLVLGAVYLRSRDLLSVILLHFLIDFSGQMFVGKTASFTAPLIAVFVIMMIMEAVYALVLVRKKN